MGRNPMDESQKAKNRCAACRTEIWEGRDVLKVEEGVIGLKGLIALEEPLYFCNEECLVKHYGEEERDPVSLPRRIP